MRPVEDLIRLAASPVFPLWRTMTENPRSIMRNLQRWIAIPLLWLLCGGAVQATTLLIPERQGVPGSLVRVDIAVDGADSLSGLEVELQYDKSYLEFIRIEPEGAVHGFLIASEEREDRIALTMARPEAIGQPYAVLCGLTFRIRQSAEIGRSCEITWKASRLYSVTTTPIVHDVIHGVVRVRDIACYPKPFTPDGNGINDVVYFVVPEEQMPGARVKIFAINGDLVREIAAEGNLYLQWDGRNAEGQLARPGVYLYLLTVNGDPLHKGTVTLMR
jgi:gliding motility-associated-like protein